MTPTLSTIRDPLDRAIARSERRTYAPCAVRPALAVAVAGSPVLAVDFAGVTNSYACDALGRRLSATDGRGNATLREYTPAGDLARIVYAAGNAAEYTVDVLGRRIAETDPLGNATHRAYDAEGRVIGEWGATYPAAYEYDAWGSRTALYTYRGTNDIASAADLLALKPSMDRTRWLLDEATGLVTNKLYADGKGPTYSYTPDGKPLHRVWARGVATDYAYDASGDLSGIVYSDDTPSVAYARDRLGRVVRAVVEGVSTNEYAYSLSGLLTNEVQNGVVLSRTYDAFSRPTGYEVLGPETGNGEPERTQRHAVAYAYDALGRFASVASGTNVFTYTRLPGTDLVTGYSCGPFRRAVTYEPQRDLITTVTNSFGDRLISAFDYVNDLAGRRISRRDTRENEVVENVFGYNLRSELTSAQMGTNSYEYAYDPIGNRQTASLNDAATTHTANNLNQYTAITSPLSPLPSHLSYDPDGNLLTNGVFSYAWDAGNRMVAAYSNDVCVVSNVYDALSRRVQKITPTATHTFLYDGWNPVREIVALASGAVTTNLYYWGMDLSGTYQGAGGIGGLLAYAQGDSLRIPFYDNLGNVVAVLDADGALVAEFKYDAFGHTIAATGPEAVAVPFRFSTKYWDEETGLYYYGYRFYDPKLGRWMNRDPIGEHGGHRLYVFCRNNALRFLDFLGLSYGNPITAFDGQVVGSGWGHYYNSGEPRKASTPFACCGETIFDSERECCVKEANGVYQVHPRFIRTNVSICCRASRIFALWPTHCWLISGNADVAGMYSGFGLTGRDYVWEKEAFSVNGVQGSVNSELTRESDIIDFHGDPTSMWNIAYWALPFMNSIWVSLFDRPNDTQNLALCKSVVLSPCEYDVQGFEECIPRLREYLKKLHPTYHAPWNDCRDFAENVIATCKTRFLRKQ